MQTIEETYCRPLPNLSATLAVCNRPDLCSQSWGPASRSLCPIMDGPPTRMDESDRSTSLDTAEISEQNKDTSRQTFQELPIAGKRSTRSCLPAATERERIRQRTFAAFASSSCSVAGICHAWSALHFGSSCDVDATSNATVHSADADDADDAAGGTSTSTDAAPSGSASCPSFFHAITSTDYLGLRAEGAYGASESEADGTSTRHETKGAEVGEKGRCQSHERPTLCCTQLRSCSD